MTAVFAPTGSYRVAVAELPLSAHTAEGAHGAIVVVSGAAWPDAALEAAASGAVAVVVADPPFVSAALLRRLEAVDVPMVIERPLLRPDVASAAIEGRRGAPPRALTADGGASAARGTALLRDAIGWLRVLSGGPLAVVVADGAFGLLETADGVAATLSIASAGRPGAGWIRVQALGETVTEVEVEGRGARVVTAYRMGRLTAPPRYESSERLALRRAVEALAAGEHPPDLRELIADTALAERLG